LLLREGLIAGYFHDWPTGKEEGRVFSWDLMSRGGSGHGGGGGGGEGLARAIQVLQGDVLTDPKIPASSPM
jgi:hypothetical protein